MQVLGKIIKWLSADGPKFDPLQPSFIQKFPMLPRKKNFDIYPVGHIFPTFIQMIWEKKGQVYSASKQVENKTIRKICL